VSEATKLPPFDRPLVMGDQDQIRALHAMNSGGRYCIGCWNVLADEELLCPKCGKCNTCCQCPKCYQCGEYLEPGEDLFCDFCRAEARRE